MSRFAKISFQVIVVGIGVTVCCGTGLAAGNFATTTTSAANGDEDQHEQSWYREQAAVKPNTLAIIQQKAEIRAEQRNSRMASLAWYGMSAARPAGSSTPFTSRYGSVWEMPGGKPYSWYPQSRPGYVMYWR